mmetsp:Transcript_21269/g.51966  ORF Transcript_21269/g.51966 Transcript_21269/m.51966 type:complete len:1037 (-) Transcript_21269:2163-5273(-)
MACRCISLEELVEVLRRSFSPHESERKHSEKRSEEIDKAPGLMCQLLDIVVSSEIDEAIRLAAAVALKNQIRKWWKDPEDDLKHEKEIDERHAGQSEQDRAILKEKKIGFREGEKQPIRSKILNAMVICTKHNLRAQLDECIRLIVLIDFPDYWPELLDSILLALASRDQMQTYCALLVLRRLVKKYEMKTDDNREPLTVIMQKTVPVVLPLGVELLRMGLRSQDCAIMLKLILKYYFSATQMALSKAPAIRQTANQWMQLVDDVLREQVPSEILPPDVSMREDLAQYKLKKWALQIAYRFFTRYGNPSFVSDSEDKDWARQFLGNWATKFLKSMLFLLDEEAQQRCWISRRMLNIILQYLSSCLEHVATYEALKAHIAPIISHVVFPLLCYDADDVETWEDDPEEFLRGEEDVFVTMQSPREAAVEFLRDLCKYRGKGNLTTILNQTHDILRRYQCSSQSEQANMGMLKVGALTMIESVAETVCDKKRSLPIEQLIEIHILPDVRSQDKFLRYRSLRTYSELLTALSKKKNISNPLLHLNFFSYLIAATEDSEKPVRVAACVAFKPFCKTKALKPVVQKNILTCLDRLLSAIYSTDSEDLVETLETLVENFQTEVVPFAQKVIEGLVVAYLRMRESEDGEADLSAFAVMKTIQTVLEACPDPKIFVSLESALSPFLCKVFQPDAIDFLEDGVSILAFLTSNEPISSGLWQHFVHIHRVVCGSPEFPFHCQHGWATDLVEFMIPVIENFVYHGLEGFLHHHDRAGKSFVALLMEMAVRITDTNRVLELVNVPCIINPLFEKCAVLAIETGKGAGGGGPIDNLIDPVLRMTWGIMKDKGWNAASTEEDCDLIARDYQMAVFSLWGNILAYDPLLFVSCTIEKPELHGLLDTWLNLVSSMSTKKGLRVKKRFVVGMTRLVQLVKLPESNIPDAFRNTLQPAMPRILQAVVRESESLHRLKKENQGKESAAAKANHQAVPTNTEGENGESGDEWSDESPESEQDLNDDQDADTAKNRIYMHKLNQMGDGDDDDSDEDYE